MKGKPNHAEAFCHMTYESIGIRKKISVVIYNSRDGVTPFVFQSKEFGVELQHVNWRADVYDPNYKPKTGDLIWRDATDEDKKEWFEAKKEMLRSVTDPQMKPMADHLLSAYEENPHIFFDEIRDGSPVFQLVN
ncbi:hypothetical protein [Dyadobacter sp. CY347]|uniref:hypothetical protein n=1 Tax=Dyadobacter sp. CY347 TaxID=2909336 RepID=UPI001F1FE9F0|nr:hypothetical protein [Dyadobacter sp. CY347]MCF2487482.1 hypothetical protein [Dyadobacter sp. CY347]